MVVATAHCRFENQAGEQILNFEAGSDLTVLAKGA
jgi:hypothetical protein